MNSDYDKANDFIRRYERIPTQIFPDAIQACKSIARRIATLILLKQSKNENLVLGLATGASPKGLYTELVRLHREENLSFKNVITFNLDEYYPINPDSIHSYRTYMNEHLFNHIDVKPENCYIPDGLTSKDDLQKHCLWYEQEIDRHGGIDFQVLGIGSNGHIGFNESGSLKNSKTRLVVLDHSTRNAASEQFSGYHHTPKTAITIGIQKIMEAKEIALLAWGENKAEIVQLAVEEKLTDRVPASFLQEHPNTVFYLDKGSSQLLLRVKSPWRVDEVVWNNELINTAIIRLALRLNKTILNLNDTDYIENGLTSLLIKDESVQDINKKVFTKLHSSITEQPGGNTNKRILIFSPHPDDDIISMGGTMRKLHEQGHEVHIVYQTSGNIAVADDEALRFTNFVADFNTHFGIGNGDSKKIFERCRKFLSKKNIGDVDSDELRYVKGLIRKNEALATCRFVGTPDQQVHFLDLPFYETGTIEKNPLSEKDVHIVLRKIKDIAPDEIYAAGDLADPHGTHKVCLDAIFDALSICKASSYTPKLWLYRGAWQEWPIEEIEMAVPLNSKEVLLKRKGIFKHQSQKDGVVFQGNDSREFWQRAEDRNRETAQLYDKLGAIEYFALEAFVSWVY